MDEAASAKDLLDDAADTVSDAIPDAAGDAAARVSDAIPDAAGDAAARVSDAIPDAARGAAARVSDAASGAWGVASRQPRRAGLVVLLLVLGALIGWRLGTLLRSRLIAEDLAREQRWVGKLLHRAARASHHTATVEERHALYSPSCRRRSRGDVTPRTRARRTDE